jgi:hypothetical protein
MFRPDPGHDLLLCQDHTHREEREPTDGKLRRTQVQGTQRRTSYSREHIILLIPVSCTPLKPETVSHIVRECLEVAAFLSTTSYFRCITFILYQVSRYKDLMLARFKDYE